METPIIKFRWFDKRTMEIIPDPVTIVYADGSFGLDYPSKDSEWIIFGGQLRHTNKHGEYYDGDVYYHAGYGNETVSEFCELQMSIMTGNSDDIERILGNIHQNIELL